MDRRSSVGLGGQGTLGCVSFVSSVPDRLRDLERQCVKGDVACASTVICARLERGRVSRVSYVANGIVHEVSAKVVIHGCEFRPFTDEEAVSALRQDVVRTVEWWCAKSTGVPCERSAYAYWTAWKRLEAARRSLGRDD